MGQHLSVRVGPKPHRPLELPLKPSSDRIRIRSETIRAQFFMQSFKADCVMVSSSARLEGPAPGRLHC